MYEYLTKGTCCSRILVKLNDRIIEDVEFEGGCNGNLKAIKKLVKGHDIDEIIAILRGNTCKNKPTSCADQLTYALEEAYKASKN
ncbi:MAG: TIGR03905 family TSCPD domain-containing protein [Succinivibrio sp.]